MRDVARNVRAVLDKLKGIKSDLVRGHERWQGWDFRRLLKAIKRWKDINPAMEASESEINQESQSTSQGERMLRMRGFCAGDPIRPDRMLEDRRMGVSIVIRPVTFQQIIT